MNHSPEPWKTSHDMLKGSNIHTDPPTRWLGTILQSQDAERIVACVNACQGLPSEEIAKIIQFGLLKACHMSDCPDWVDEALQKK